MKLMVLDGNSIVNRAFYGVKPLSTRDGQPTNALFGFLNILLKLVEDEKPEGLCVTFDLHAPTFRHKAFADYKAQRKPMPEELRSQMPILKELLTAMRIPYYEQEGWEADDLIGTIARRCEGAGWSCRIVTGDKDSLQLVTEATHVLLVTTRMGRTTTEEVTPESFREKYGFAPAGMIDLKAFMGDSSDNYPGVAGIGEKTAMDLIGRYGTVEGVYRALDDGTLEAKPAVVKKLTAGRADAAFSYDLATIRTDAPLDFAPADARRQEPDKAALYALLTRLEFSKLIQRLDLADSPAAPAAELPQRQTERVEDGGTLAALLEEWRGVDHVSLAVLPSLDGAAVCRGDRVYLVFQSDLGAEYDKFLAVVFGGGVKKIAHETKELMGRLLAEGLSTDGFLFDTAVAAYLLAPTDGSYALDKLGMTYFNRMYPAADAYLAPDAFAPLGDHTAAEGALAAHAGLVEDLYAALAPKLEELGMHKLYYEVELPLCPVLAEMERAGVLVDRGALARFGEMLTAGIDRARDSIYQLAGEEFNINSPKQLGHILFEVLGLPPSKKTKTGYATGAEVLEKLQDVPIVSLILDYRQLTKLNSTYVDGLMKVIAPDGRIHTSFQNTVTATGRLSSAEPNLQNIPVRTELGAEMRKMFVAGPGNVLVDMDYSQIELRLLAHIADDKAMQQAFREGTDIHTVTASQVFGVPVEAVTRQMRSSAKAVNFGIVYGISEFSLAKDIGVSIKEAKAYMERYFAHYSGIRSYMTDVVARAKEDGYVSTLLGRRRWLPELRASNFNQRAFGERVALNMPIQGTAADIIKLAMLRVQTRLKAEGLRGRLVLQVHDELIVECPAEEGQKVLALLKEEMEGVMPLSVPLVAEGAVGACWADAH